MNRLMMIKGRARQCMASTHVCSAFVLSVLTALFALSTLSAQAATTTRYVILSGDNKPAGEQVVERADNGVINVRFSYKQNGRGPDLTERIRMAPDGSMTEYSVKGAATMGGPVEESFVRKGDKAEWQSLSEKGSTDVKGAAMYLPLNSSFEITSLQIAAVAAQPDGKLPLLPSGSLSQRKLDEMEVSQNSQTRRVQLIAQTGIGFTPSFAWATVEPKPRMFAVIIPGWLSVIEQGWEGSAQALAARQLTAERGLLKEMAVKLRHPLQGLTVVRNARVFDSNTAKLGAASDVYIMRGRITAVLPAGTLAHKADQEIDAQGRVMLPGLFDMHGHVDRWDGGLHLAAGVTTVRDMGNDNSKMQRMLDELQTGELLSPQIVPCGFLEGDSPYASRNGFVIKTYQEAKDAVDWYAARGYPQLKIYNSFPKEMVKDIVAYAHQRGMRVSGHVPVFMRAAEVVEQGYDELQHINQVLLNFLVTPTTDTRTLERFYLPAEKTGALDFESQPVKDFLSLLKQRNVAVDPTLATFDFLKQREGELSAPYAAAATNMPPDVQRGLRSGGMKIPDDATAARYKASYDKMVDFVGRLYRAGIPLVAGTDALAGFTLHSELELYVKAGLTPAQALQMATLNGAKYSGVSRDRGSIEAGKLADLILVDGDPTKDIADLRKVSLVMTQGQWLSPVELHQALGVTPFVQNAPTPRAMQASTPVAVHTEYVGGAHHVHHVHGLNSLIGVGHKH